MKMKKYLMTGIAALALCVGFTSCSHDLESLTPEEIDQLQAQKIIDNYNKAFKAYVGGEIAPTQTWGFGTPAAGARTRSGNTAVEGYTTWPYTHGYEDANGNLIASANMNHNQWGSTDLQSMPYGGWIVPDPLTEGQKLRVQLYFQSHPDLDYEDPQYANFFVQQVYTGGTSAPETGNKESTVSADGQGHAGMTLNQLTVGQAASHINDFNAGTCTTSQVLNHEGKTQSDQITLMLNVDDTSCFGFHETSGSNVNSNENSNVYNHNDKMALVSAATIDAWAKTQSPVPGEDVVDKWNRSFMGFDYELLPESDIVTDNYAMLSNWDGNLPEYAWDGTNVMKIGSGSTTVEAGIQYDLTSTFNNSWNGTMTTNNGEITFASTGGSIQAGYFGNDLVAHWAECTKFVIVFKEATPADVTLQLGGSNYTIAKGTTTYELDITNISASGAQIDVPSGNSIVISRIYIETGAKQDDTLYYDSQYLLAGGTNQICFYSTNTNMYGGVLKSVSSADMTTTVDGKSCINLKWIKEELYDKGYHPISTDLKTWVKWQAACDGYYSDWIVTLTEAKRIGDEPGPGPGPGPDPDPDPTTYSVRVMAEDLSATEASDFDFNDVVIDVYYTTDEEEATIILQAAGGTLPLRINGDDALEVHDLFGVGRNIMVNTGWGGSNGAVADPVVIEHIPFVLTDLDEDGEITENDFLLKVKTITLEVYKTLPSGNPDWFEMTADEGAPAAKFAVPIYKSNGEEVRWANERVSLKSIYGKFSDWATESTGIMWWDTEKAAEIEAEEEAAKQNQGN